MTPGAQGVVVMDRAGWHTTGKLATGKLATGKLNVPKNITIIFLPSREPELNPAENVWHYLRDNWLSKRVFEDYEDILDAATDAWNRLIKQPDTIRSIGSRKWINVRQI